MFRSKKSRANQIHFAFSSWTCKLSCCSIFKVRLACPQATFLFYHFQLRLSSTFLKSFFGFLETRSPDFKAWLTPDFADCEALFGEPLGPALKVLDYNIIPYYFCQYFFSRFFDFSWKSFLRAKKNPLILYSPGSCAVDLHGFCTCFSIGSVL